MEKQQKLNLIYAIVAVIGILFLHELWVQQQTIQPVPFSDFEEHLKAGEISQLTIRENQIVDELANADNNGKKFIVANRVDPSLVEYLSQFDIPYTQVHESKSVWHVRKTSGKRSYQRTDR